MRPLPLLAALAVLTATPAAAQAADPSVHGTVTDQGGGPLAHVLVTGRTLDGAERTALTDAAGDYVLALPAPGDWTLRFDPTPESALVASDPQPGFPGPRIDVTVPAGGTAEVDRTLVPGGGVAGLVEGSDGTAVSDVDAAVATTIAFADPVQAWDAARRPGQYAAGRYAVLGLAPGRWRVSLGAPAAGTYPLLGRWSGGPAAPLGVDLIEDAVEVDVRAGVLTPEVSVTPTRSARLAGRVVDGTGAGLPGATIRADRLDLAYGRPAYGDTLFGQTDDQGRYDLGPARPGSWAVCSSYGPCDPGHRAVVQLDGGRTTTSPDVSPFSTNVPPPTPVLPPAPSTTPTTTATTPVPPPPGGTTTAPVPTPPATTATTTPLLPAAPTTTSTTTAAAPTAAPTIAVAAAPGAAPVLTAQLPQAGTLSARMTARGRLLGTGTARRTAAGRVRLRLTLNHAGRTALRRPGATRAVIRVTFRPLRGAATSVSRTTTLRARR